MGHLSAKKARIGYCALSICVCAVGVVLVLRPGLPIEWITYLVGAVLIGFGAMKLCGFFCDDPYGLAFAHDLTLGILIMAVGVILILRPQVLVSTLCVIAGVTILADGLSKVQISLEAKAFGLESWGVILAVGVLTGVLGFLLVFNPWESMEMLVTLLGLTLFVEGVLNLVTALTAIKVYKAASSDSEPFQP